MSAQCYEHRFGYCANAKASLAYQARTSVDAAALDNVGTSVKLSRPRLKQLLRASLIQLPTECRSASPDVQTRCADGWPLAL